MRTVSNDAEMKEIEHERALVGVYVDRAYSDEKIRWVLDSKRGFDEHARDAWHLLIPVQEGYGVDAWIRPEDYGVGLAGLIIDKLGIAFNDLPCVAFRAGVDEFYFLKLGDKPQEQFLRKLEGLPTLLVNAREADLQTLKSFAITSTCKSPTIYAAGNC